MLGPLGTNSTARIVLAAAAAGGLHSWLMYSLGVYSMHEGRRAQADLSPGGSCQPGLPLALGEPVPDRRIGADPVLDAAT